MSFASQRRSTVSKNNKSATKQTHQITGRRRKPKQNGLGGLPLILRLTLIVLLCVIILTAAVLLRYFLQKCLLLSKNSPLNYSAVEKAKFYGLSQRKMNSGQGDASFWSNLSNATCDDQGAYEMLELGEIQRLQLPRAILIGVQKGGTTALFQYLDQHPSVERTKKELYFLDEDMDRLVGHAGTIPRKVARNLYHQKMRDGMVEARALEKQKNRHMHQLKQKLKQNGGAQLADSSLADNKQLRTRRLQQTDKLLPIVHGEENTQQKEDLDDGFSRSHHGPPPGDGQIKPIKKKTTPAALTTNKFVMDLTPNYMFHSDRVPNRIKCLVPWVRLLVLLRDPVARARSQYQMKLQMVLPKSHNSYGNPIPSLDEYIENDLNALEEVGVLKNWTEVDFESFWKSEECWKAWQTYIHKGLNAPVGMGLYALQLKPFLDVLVEIHHGSLELLASHGILSDYFLAIDSRDLQMETDKTYQEVLKFLRLPSFSLTEYARVNKASSKDHAQLKSKLSPAIQKRMQDAIAPYNRKLGDLLGEEWKDKWTSR
ncbi:unnamed protein product [Cylindrotheca closterium]|uniref:Uncharacterized protein n=1 Tax=Cylindrotheca closterium TaxID=2856 RepID=A0AAD2PWM3_9STRA|nr:unnamed protein product [Cylindrotheca closterium]